MHSNRTLLRLAAACALAVPLSAQTWATVPTASNPGGDSDSHISLAFHLITGQVVKYGGRVNANLTNQTWTYDGTNWTLRTPANNPGTRWGHRLVSDMSTSRVLLFGGRTLTPGPATDDIWSWNGTDWTQIVPTTSLRPGGRVWANAAYDSRRGRLVVYGGFGNLNTDTWEFDGSEWHQLTPAHRPPNVYDGDMVYDASRGVCVMFSGFDGSTASYAGTWEWDGFDWRETFTATDPSAPVSRYRHALSYDMQRGVVIMYGGYGGGSRHETWSYDGKTWRLEAIAGTPPPQPVQGGLTYDVFRDRHVQYGGSGPSPGVSTTTSEFQAATRPSYATAGAGCPGSNGGVVRLASAPGSEARSGLTLTIEATGAPAGAVATTLIFGFSNHSFGGTPLPLDLSFLGLAGCRLDCALDLDFPAPIVGGTATWSLPLPAAINGVTFWNQALVLDLAAPGMATLSNGARGYVVP